MRTLSLAAGILFLLSPVVRQTSAAQQSVPPAGMVLEKVALTRDSSQSYALYLPAGYSRERTWPVLFALDPAGRGQIPVELFREAAKRYGYVVIGSNAVRNGPVPEQASAFQAMWNDAHDRFALDPKRAYIVGFSGTARTASLIAKVCNCVTGLVLTAAGFSPDVAIDSPLPWAVFLAASAADFNFLEVIQLHQALEKAGTATRLEEFDGGHDWPPARVALAAVEWLELRAMRGNLRPRNEEFVKIQWERRFDDAKTKERNKDFLGAHQEYRSLVADFTELQETREAASRIIALEKRRELRQAQERQQRMIALERQTIEEMAAKINALPQSLESSPQVANDVRRSMAELKSRLDGERDIFRRQALARAVQWLLVSCIEMGEQAASQRKYPLALAYYDVAIEAALRKGELYYRVASVFALEGDTKQTLAALRAAKREGFSDFSRLRADPAFQSVRDEPEFQALVQEQPAQPSTTPAPTLHRR